MKQVYYRVGLIYLAVMAATAAAQESHGPRKIVIPVLEVYIPPGIVAIPTEVSQSQIETLASKLRELEGVSGVEVSGRELTLSIPEGRALRLSSLRVVASEESGCGSNGYLIDEEQIILSGRVELEIVEPEREKDLWQHRVGLIEQTLESFGRLTYRAPSTFVLDVRAPQGCTLNQIMKAISQELYARDHRSPREIVADMTWGNPPDQVRGSRIFVPIHKKNAETSDVELKAKLMRIEGVLDAEIQEAQMVLFVQEGKKLLLDQVAYALERDIPGCVMIPLPPFAAIRYRDLSFSGAVELRMIRRPDESEIASIEAKLNQLGKATFDPSSNSFTVVSLKDCPRKRLFKAATLPSESGWGRAEDLTPQIAWIGQSDEFLPVDHK